MDLAKRFRQLVEAGEKAFYNSETEAYERATRLAAKILRDLAQADQLDAALSLEPEWYNRLVKKVEKEEHYHRCFSWHKDAFWEAGRRANKHNPLDVHPASDGVIKVAFLAHSGVLLGHTEVMLRVIGDWREAGAQVRPYFVSLTGIQPELKARLQELEIPFAVAPKGLRPVAATEWLRTALIKTGISTAVWLSTPCWVPYIFGYGVAAKQVIWSLKFHAVHMGKDVVHISQRASGEEFLSINGCPWVPFIPPYSIKSARIPNAQEIRIEREKFPASVMLCGALAREEILNSREYIAAVIKILDAEKGAHFIYSGRKEPSILARALGGYGLSNRVHYVGWVDTEIYARIIDLYLDPFPYGSGITCIQALCSGTQVVSMWGQTTLPRTFGSESWQHGTKIKNWHVALSEGEYVESALSVLSARAIKKQPDSREKIYDFESGRSLRLLQIILGRSL